MSPQRRNNPDVESPAQEFPSRRQTDQESTEAERPADDNHGTADRDEEE
jgi:hypothetical protein